MKTKLLALCLLAATLASCTAKKTAVTQRIDNGVLKTTARYKGQVIFYQWDRIYLHTPDSIKYHRHTEAQSYIDKFTRIDSLK
jgi:hypothetical protein